MHRQTLLAASAAVLTAPSIARAAQSVLRVVPQANLTAIDPIWTTAKITRNHGFMVYDTLYGLDASLQPQPQMAAGYQIENDGRLVTITLRDGLLFHDNEKVRAANPVANLRFRLKKLFPLLYRHTCQPERPGERVRTDLEPEANVNGKFYGVSPHSEARCIFVRSEATAQRSVTTNEQTGTGQ